MSDKQNPDQPVDGLAKIWSKVDVTPPAYTRAMDGDFRGTAINPTFQIRRATEQWGPMGLGWGFDVLEEHFEQGAPMGMTSGGENLGFERHHMLRGKLWYMVDGVRGEVEQYGQTPYVYISGERVVTENDVKKKSMTDAMMKCLSLLGFSADVYMGRYDDSKYVASLLEQQNMAPAPKAARGLLPAVEQGVQQQDSGPVRDAHDEAARVPHGDHAEGTAVDRPDPGANGEVVILAENTTVRSEDAAGEALAAERSLLQVNQIDPWLRRVAAMGIDGLSMAKTTVRSVLSGAALEEVENAIARREQQLSSH